MYLILGKEMFFKKDYAFSWANFIKKAGVKKGSYAASLVDAQYDIFENAISLNQEYKKYYAKEFDTFEKYLSQRHNLMPDEIEKLLPGKIFYAVDSSVSKLTKPAEELEGYHDLILLMKIFLEEHSK